MSAGVALFVCGDACCPDALELLGVVDAVSAEAHEGVVEQGCCRHCGEWQPEEFDDEDAAYAQDCCYCGRSLYARQP